MKRATQVDQPEAAAAEAAVALVPALGAAAVTGRCVGAQESIITPAAAAAAAPALWAQEAAAAGELTPTTPTQQEDAKERQVETLERRGLRALGSVQAAAAVVALGAHETLKEATADMAAGGWRLRSAP